MAVAPWALVLSIIGSLIVGLGQIVTPLGFAWRPLYTEKPKGHTCGLLKDEIPYWARYLVFAIGWHFIWGALMFLVMDSKQGSYDKHAAGTLMVLADCLVVFGALAMHLRVLKWEKHAEASSEPFRLEDTMRSGAIDRAFYPGGGMILAGEAICMIYNAYVQDNQRQGWAVCAWVLIMGGTFFLILYRMKLTHQVAFIYGHSEESYKSGMSHQNPVLTKMAKEGCPGPKGVSPIIILSAGLAMLVWVIGNPGAR